MSNRLYTQFRYSLVKKVVDLFADVTFGASGAPTLVSANSKGVKSITRTSAGLYVITLTDSFKGLLMLKHMFLDPSAAPASPGLYIVSHTVGTNNPPTITVQFNAAGTATDPASGEEVLLQFALRDSDAI